MLGGHGPLVANSRTCVARVLRPACALGRAAPRRADGGRRRRTGALARVVVLATLAVPWAAACRDAPSAPPEVEFRPLPPVTPVPPRPEDPVAGPAPVAENPAAPPGTDAVPPPDPRLADGDRAAAVRDAWIAGPLIGRDNSMARMREVRISARPDGTHTVFIRNQFAWTCGLDFDATGRPARVTGCRSAEAGWRASPAEVPLVCEQRERDEVCTGTYRLLYPSGGGSPAEFRIVRRLP